MEEYERKIQEYENRVRICQAEIRRLRAAVREARDERDAVKCVLFGQTNNAREAYVASSCADDDFGAKRSAFRARRRAGPKVPARSAPVKAAEARKMG